MLVTIFLGCTSKKPLENALDLLDRGKYEEAIIILQKEVISDSTNPDVYLALGNALLYKSNFYRASSGDWHQVIDKAKNHYRSVLGIDSTSVDALYYLGLLYGISGEYKDAINYLRKVYSNNPGHSGALHLLYRYELLEGKRKEAIEHFNQIKIWTKLVNSKWKTVVPKEQSQGNYVIIKRDNTKGYQETQSSPGAVNGDSRPIENFRKYDMREYSYFNGDKYYYVKKGIGWVPRDKRWFRGVFEEADYSDEANVYMTPGGARYKKSYISNLKRLNQSATTQSAGGIVQEGWYKVSFDLPANNYLNAEDVALGLGIEEIDRERIYILGQNSYWGDLTCGNLLDCKLTKGLTDLMAQAAIGFCSKHEIRPQRGILKETFSNDYMKLEFENGQLKKWALLKPEESQSKGKSTNSQQGFDMDPVVFQQAKAERILKYSTAFTGKWIGNYSCGQGITGLTLSISMPSTNTSINAIFDFYPTPQNPNVKSGSYSLVGHFTEEGAFDLRPQSWIRQPQHYIMVGMSGKINDGFNKLEGTIASPNCSSFELHKE